MRKYKNTLLSLSSFVATLFLISFVLLFAPYLAFSFSKIISYDILFLSIFLLCLTLLLTGVLFAKKALRSKENMLINNTLIVVNSLTLLFLLIWYGYASSFI